MLHLLDPVIRRVTKNLVEDVYFYFYGKREEERVRDAILDRMGAMLNDFHPHVIIAHSWGYRHRLRLRSCTAGTTARSTR